MKILDAGRANSLEGGASFSLGNRAFRAVWIVAWAVLAGWTPAPLHRWRRFVLRCFGATIGRGARIYGGATIWYPPTLTVDDFATIGPGARCYNQAPIRIGARAVVSQGAYLCTGTHDVADPNFQLLARPITIGARAWVAAEAFVGPGVVVGEGAVLGARGCAYRELKAWTIYAGNPATALRPRVLRDGPRPGP